MARRGLDIRILGRPPRIVSGSQPCLAAIHAISTPGGAVMAYNVFMCRFRLGCVQSRDVSRRTKDISLNDHASIIRVVRSLEAIPECASGRDVYSHLHSITQHPTADIGKIYRYRYLRS